MPQTFTKLTYHFVWSTHGRRAGLYEEMRARLHAYIAQVVNRDFGLALEVGGVDDHIHLLCELRPTVGISEFMQKVKAISSGWMRREFAQLTDVAWQEGYAAFTVSASAVPAVRRYIQQQERHHRGFGFDEEFRRLLTKHGVGVPEGGRS